jgi:hypothetical protein
LLTILVLVLICVTSAPAYAHTTIGDLNSSSPLYRTNDNELNSVVTSGNHVPGPLGYVWPGSGMNTYSGVRQNPPGYQSPFTNQKPIQAARDSYSPEGAILTSTADHDNVGDLIFALNFSNPSLNGNPPFTIPTNACKCFNYTSLTIYIPAPVFDRTGTLVQDGFEPTKALSWDQGDNSNIVTTITDNYGNIFITRADQYDPFEPGSWIVYIQGPPSGITFSPNNGRDNWYYVRINQMKAPFTAGRYFFKMFLNNSYPLHRGDLGVKQYIMGTMPMENWPVLLVKGEVDPAIISGTIRFGDLNSTLYGLPINLPGRVRAVGIASNPTSLEPTGRAVEAHGYFNATAKGHYEIEGVAPGLYTIYASAAGMPEQKIATNVRVARGQSLHFDGYLQVGPQLRGTVFSKQGYGTVQWPAQRPISIVVYDSKSYDLPSIVTSSPINLTGSPYTSYVIGNTTFNKNGLFSGLTDLPGLPGLDRPKEVAFPWEGPTSYYSYTTPNKKDPFGLFNGVGPAQAWWVDPRSIPDPNTALGSSSSEFTFQFGDEDVYGVPTKFSGMVPQVFATWTDSLSPGRYYVRAFLNGYVQTGIDGTLFVDYSFDVPYVGPMNVYVPIDLIPSCDVNVTIHFHDIPGSLVERRVQGPDPARYLISEAFARDGTLAAFNFTKVNANQSNASILLNGLGMAGNPNIIFPLTDSREPIKYSLARYRSTNIYDYQNIYQNSTATSMGSYDYGLPTDIYTIRVFMRGYIQALPPAKSFDELDQPLTVNLGTGSCISQVSLHMYRGGSINATATSIDWQRPTVERNWVWNSAPVNILVYDISSVKFIDVINFWNANAPLNGENANQNTNLNMGQWTIPSQDSVFKTLPWPGWRDTFGLRSSYIMTNGSVQVDRFGPDLPIYLTSASSFSANASISSDPGQTLVTWDFVQENVHEGFLYNFTSYRYPSGTDSYRSNIAIYPGTYALSGWTYGYVQDNVINLQPGVDLGNVYVAVPWLGQMADINLKLMIGVNLTLTMIFKTEQIISGMPYNSSVRIRVFDDVDRLVAATTLISSDAGTLFPSPNSAEYNSAGYFANGNKIVNAAIPEGTTLLTYKSLAGSFDYIDPNSPIANVRTVTLFSGDHGIWGRSSYRGGYSGEWTIMVDIVNWSQLISSYPPVQGLLQGESPYFFPYNHLGPYQEKQWIKVSNAPLTGEASAEFELDLRGYVQATILGMNWDDSVRTLSWASLQIVDSSNYQYYWYSWDGWVDGYLNPGRYQVTISEWSNNAGHLPIKFVLQVSPGQQASLNYILTESQIPILELPTLPLNLLCLSNSVSNSGLFDEET